jgi:hypothetical protein
MKSYLYQQLIIYKKIKHKINQFLLRISASFRINTLQQSIRNFRNVDILVLGSAPHPILPDLAKDMVIVCCNGSAANAKRLGLKAPAMTVVDFELIDPEIAFSKSVRNDILQKKILSNLQLGILVGTQSNSAAGGSPQLLDAKYERFLSIDRYVRREIFDFVTDTDKLERDARVSLCSTGAFAVAISLFLGARSVSLAGFTHVISSDDFGQMHFYDESSKTTHELDTRNHSMADSAFISLSVINGYKIHTCERDFLPLVQNWGNKGPSW